MGGISKDKTGIRFGDKDVLEYQIAIAKKAEARKRNG